MKPRTTKSNYQLYEPTVGNAYHIDVEVPTPFGSTAYFFALVDTGADDLVLPDAYLPDFFPKGTPPPVATVTTAGGPCSMPIYRTHTFRVDGVTVKSDVVFSPALGAASALCGRVPLIRCSPKFGLRLSELLRDSLTGTGGPSSRSSGKRVYTIYQPEGVASEKEPPIWGNQIIRERVR